jgi:periplasmic divalent cation tolerance protein
MAHEASPVEPVVVLVTWPADRDPSGFARDLVERRLAACVNVGPEMQSVYRWKDAVNVDAERQLVIKTVAACLPALEARVGDQHPYELPEFLVLGAVAGADAYVRWLAECSG